MTHEQQEVMSFVTEWYGVATGARRLPDDAYFRFLALWVAFNGLYSLTFPEAKSEAAQIRSFGNWDKAKKAHAEALGTNNTLYRGAIDILGEKGVFNYLTKNVERITDIQDLQGVVRLVYRVRCNLFHGRKVPSNLRDHKLVEASHIIVSELMRRLIEPPCIEAGLPLS